jgi:hypothetical protein
MPTLSDLARCKFCDELIAWTHTVSKTGQKRFVPKNPDGTHHLESCSGMSPTVRATARLTNHETSVRRFLASHKKKTKAQPVKAATAAASTTATECKFCKQPITWQERVPFNADGSRHAARCTGLPSGQLKNVIESMITETRANSTFEPIT